MLERTATLEEYGHFVNILLKDYQNWVLAKFYPRSPTRHLRHSVPSQSPCFPFSLANRNLKGAFI
jgi:hypothetical protein